MDIKVLFLLIFLNTINCNNSPEEELINYYEKLIKEEIAKSSTYRFPTDASSYRPKNTIPTDFGLYDFVIIGGGTAGSVIASRLSEVSEWKILLLEAGKEENNFTEMPSMSKYTANSEYNWGFNSTPQATCCLASGGVCPFPRGRALGGTGVTNALIYTRGNKLDYDKWASQGNPGWSYEDVLPYFIKSENSKIVGDDGYHGIGGYVDVEHHLPKSEKLDIFLEANKELGYPTTDINGKNQLGASSTQFTTTNGRRVSTARAFLTPARNRTNLTILTKSYVTQILLTNKSDKAYGVLFSRHNHKYIVRVDKEVILSAGVVGSPQVLILSGIGPEDHLQELGISIERDLAVGKDMHDHTTFNNIHFTTPNPEPFVELREAIKQYVNGTGPLTIVTNLEGIAYYNLEEETNLPEIEIMFTPSTKSYSIDNNTKGIVQKNTNQYNIFQMSLVLLHPKTRGRLYLNSKDPYEYPLIESTCLADRDNQDIENLYKAMQTIVNKLLETKAFNKLNATILPYDACLTEAFLSKEYWFCVIRHTTRNSYHGGGTCRMGPDPTQGDVVDNKLRVHGISNLRVADASIIPVTLSGHTYAAAIMIGEKVSDFIKDDYAKNIEKRTYISLIPWSICIYLNICLF